MKIFGFDDYQVLNESFKSGKLRNIIQQHGMPKYEQDRKFLYDLQDDEVLGVMDFEDWYDFHRDNRNSYHIALEDGKYLVLGNIDTLKYYADDKDFQEEFKKRRDERHPGNELNDVPAHKRQKALEDEVTRRFREKKNELIHSRNVEGLKERIGNQGDELIKIIRDDFIEYIRNCDTLLEEVDIDNKEDEYEFDIEFLNVGFTVLVKYYLSVSDGIEKFGAKFYDVTVKPYDVELADDEDSYGINEIVDEPGNLFDEYVMDDVEGEVSDYYDYYGVSRGDFF